MEAVAKFHLLFTYAHIAAKNHRLHSKRWRY